MKNKRLLRMKQPSLSSIGGCLLLLSALLFVACGTKKSVGEGSTLPETVSVPAPPKSDASLETARMNYVKKVADNAVSTENIVAGMTFSVKNGSKDLSAPGTLRMRKDEVIRLQITIPILGTEIARVEFTPDYVLIVDRLHKEYIKAPYADLHFLRDNGIDFYALQALFWNQLHVPGKKAVTQKDFKAFKVDIDKSEVTLQQGKMAYTWATTPQGAQISETGVKYSGSNGSKSSLKWTYSDFKSFEGKTFPTQHNIAFSTNATEKPRRMEVNVELGSLSSNAKWDALTTISGKYKQMDGEALLKKILNM
ncbi:MAG: DUF4292 domain-containing protein [Prevotella sp.]|nr:DUF4292 domain-containing protein [Prevotella sp.]